MVIIFLSESMVASKSITSPSSSVSFRVIKVSTFESVNSESSVFCIASLNVSVIFALSAIPVALSTGLKVIVGASPSAVVKLSVVASEIPAYELLELSSNPVAAI